MYCNAALTSMRICQCVLLCWVVGVRIFSAKKKKKNNSTRPCELCIQKRGHSITFLTGILSMHERINYEAGVVVFLTGARVVFHVRLMAQRRSNDHTNAADAVASSSGSTWNNERLISHTATTVQLNYPATENTSEGVQSDDPEECRRISCGCVAASSFVETLLLIIPTGFPLK